MAKIVLLKDLNKERKSKYKQLPKEIHTNDRDKYWQKYYQTSQWKNLRALHRQEQPLCQCCLKYFDRVRAVEEVHHICKISNGANEYERMMLLTDPDNIVSLCKECHDNVHNGMYPEYMITIEEYYKRKEDKTEH